MELDLEKFFDRVNHYILMAHIERQIDDKRVLRLIRRTLRPGSCLEVFLADGKVAHSRRCCRTSRSTNSTASWNHGVFASCYADDANIYVRSCRAGERVVTRVERFLSQSLKLTLNREKIRVARPWICDYLGYGMS